MIPKKIRIGTCSLIKRTVCFFMALCLLGCSNVEFKSDPKWIGYTESAKAAYYAMILQFRKTAGGERFNQYSHTAAHRTLPFGTKVKVTNVRSGKIVIVKINDRGPFVKGRIIDLSRSAFKQIGNIDSGVINVKIEVIK